jgi:hypothetical protein
MFVERPDDEPPPPECKPSLFSPFPPVHFSGEIRVHPIFGKLAAAMAWPWRFSISSGM